MILSQMTDTEIQRELGRRLREYRLQQNLAVEDLARLAGVSKTTLAKMERGMDFRLSSLLRILRALGRLDALDAFLPPPAISPMDLLRRRGRGPRRRAYRARRPAAGKGAAPPLESAAPSSGAEAPVFERGTGVARVGVPDEPPRSAAGTSKPADRGDG